MNLSIDQVILIYALLFDKAAGNGLGLPEVELWEMVSERLDEELLGNVG